MTLEYHPPRNPESPAPGPKARRGAIPIISLFCGCGGMDLGFLQGGFSTILAIDHDEAALRTFQHNHAGVPILQADISSLSSRTVFSVLKRVAPGIRPRGVIGGPPCQPFSRGNVHKTTNDSRDRLPLHYAELLARLNARFHLDFFVFENVAGLTTKLHRRHFRKILNALESAGFNIFTGELDAQEFGVPQLRRRLFVVGINKGLYPWISFAYPDGSRVRPPRTVRDAIGGLPSPVYFARGLRPSQIPYHPNHWTMRPISDKFRSAEYRRWSRVHNNGRSFRRLEWDKPSATVAYGHREIHVHPDGRRRLSILEALLLQGFPRRYVLLGNMSEQVQQISDAVPPPLARAVARSLRSALYSKLEKVGEASLRWFASHEREYPWRRSQNPYHILIAEKLLQQTAVDSHVVRSYEELTSRYPDARLLSRASKTEVEAIIAPLGLRYRAVELIKLARAIEEKFGSKLPSEYGELVALPGIGDYISRAIQSFAYGRDVPVVDTNISRLVRRYFGLTTTPPKNPARNRLLLTLVANLVPPGRSREFNLALIDICAAHCTALRPHCTACPLAKSCHYGSKSPPLEDFSDTPRSKSEEVN